MTRASKALVVLIVASLGLLGCAQGPANGPHAAEKIKSLENKCAKLEDDYKAVAEAREVAKKKVAALEQERKKMKDELDVLANAVKERDELRAQFDQFRKGLRSLLGQADAALTAPTPPAATTSTVVETAPGGKS